MGTSLDTRSPFKEAIQNAKLSGKQSTKLDTKKSRRKNVTMSPTKYLFKIPKLSVKLDMKRDAKTNGSVLIIQNKITLITVKTKNGNQPTKDAGPFTNKYPLKSPERLPSENALEKLPMNTLPLKSEKWISLVIRFYKQIDRSL